MEESDHFQFLTTLNRELCAAVVAADETIEPCGHDSYSALTNAVEGPITLELLKGLNDLQIRQIATAFNDFFECSAIKSSHIRQAIDSTIWHWGG